MFCTWSLWGGESFSRGVEESWKKKQRKLILLPPQTYFLTLPLYLYLRWDLRLWWFWPSSAHLFSNILIMILYLIELIHCPGRLIGDPQFLTPCLICVSKHCKTMHYSVMKCKRWVSGNVVGLPKSSMHFSRNFMGFKGNLQYRKTDFGRINLKHYLKNTKRCY